MADVTTLQVMTGDITNVILADNDTTSVIVRDGDITTIVAAPATITLPGGVALSDIAPFDISRIADSGSLDIASRADHVHSIANTLLDGGNY